MRTKALSGLLIAAASIASAQTAEPARPPVIDIHVHTFGGVPGVGPMCPFNPQFLAADPRVKADQIGWAKQDCTERLEPSKTQEEYMKAVLAEYERLNVTAVVMGDQKSVQKWKDAAPARIIPGTSFDAGMGGGKYLPVEELRKAFTTGGSGRANITMPKFRGSMGNPLLLEDLLARHPKLRVWIMHAGYPMIDQLLTLLQANAYVYVDVAGLIWSYPLKEVHNYIQRIVEAGFEDRVMYGTDQLIWPKLMATSISVIEGATYLTPQQKRDILYNNAARFLRLDKPDKK